ncbi:Peptidase family S41 [Sphingomonas sp. NFR04]|uniref:S41 family peptidase n=1 Tax=Sphingomonas sp. NFR04 TaxID=1566283 RepID=UPI0008EDA73C|nr:S41 family peptidase [Sphingomonas sp. NFR04]SFJ07947.1 Peptidase family S41 [Sphingomonas sp. NFR04]
MIDRRQMLARLSATAAAATLPFAARAVDGPTAADLKGDVAILREALALHPGLYRYNSPAQIEARLAQFEAAFVAASRLETRYLLLSRFLATIRCGHSYCNFFNQKKPVTTALFARSTRLPFHFRWIGGAMIVTEHGGSDLPRGSEVLAINGVAPRDMLAQLLPYARADGHNDAKRVSLLEVRGDDDIEFFDVFHGLAFGAPPGSLHRITARRPDGKRVAAALPAIDLDQRRAQRIERDYRGGDPVWDWSLRSDGIAVLTMPSWALYDSKWDWQGWLDDRLDSLAGAKGLVIDLRGNEGGEDCGDRILARLIRAPVVTPLAERRVRFRRTPASLNPYLDTWDDSFRMLGVDARPGVNGFYVLQGAHADSSIQPAGRPLDLPVAALIGPVNSSATFQFAENARRSGRVRLFGATTGGNRRGINGGCFFFVRLPASGIEFDLPLIGYFRLRPEPDTGIAPDIAVATSVADVAAGRDPVMRRATEWLNQRG